ncbi:MAG: hypothetical protein ACRD0N_14800 [Acidimicrobiales bacterium]
MNPIAFAPGAVLLVGMVAAIPMVARLLDEANQLRASLRRATVLHPLVADLSDETRRLQATLARLRDR